MIAFEFSARPQHALMIGALFVGLFAGACGGDDRTAGTSDGGIETGQPDAVALDGAPGDVADAGPSQCSSREAGTTLDGGGACNTLEPCLAPIVYQKRFVGRPASSAAAGTVFDGTYFLSADEVYKRLDAGVSDGGGTTGTNPRRQVWVVSGGTVQVASLYGEVMLDTFSGTYAVAGTQLTVTNTCQPDAGGPVSVDYTATPTTLTLYQQQDDETDVTVYTKP